MQVTAFIPKHKTTHLHKPAVDRKIGTARGFITTFETQPTERMKVFGLFIFLAALGLGCAETSGDKDDNPAQDTEAVYALQAEMELLKDSISGLQSALLLAQKERDSNDSLRQLVASLIRSKASQPVSDQVESTSAGRLAKLNESLLRQRDSLLAANAKVVREIDQLKTASKLPPPERAVEDSLLNLNSDLTASLANVQQKLTSLSRQKKKDSLALVVSGGSSSQYQKEMNLLMRQRDSLEQANLVIAKRSEAYQKNLELLTDQRKKDSLALANTRSNREANAAVATENQAAAKLAASQKEIDSLKSQLALLSQKLETTDPEEMPPGMSTEENRENADSAFSSIKRWTDTENKAATSDLREGFRLLLLAQQAEKTDPTLSLKLLREALRYSDDSLIVKETRRVYDNYYFYETLVQKRRPARSFSLNETYLAVNLANDSAYLYHGIDSILQQVQGYSRVSAVLLPPQAYLFTGHPTGQVSMYNLTTGKQQNRFQAHDERVTALGFIGKNEAFIATGSTDKTIYLWTNKFEKGSRLVGLRSAVTHIDVSRSLLIAGASGDLAPRLWNTEGKLLLNLTGHEDSVYSMDISDNARYLLTSSRDRTAQIWDLKGTFVRAIGGHRAVLTRGIFSHSQRLVALASADGSISLWNFNGAPLGKLLGHGQHVNQLVFDKTDTYLYSCSDDGTVRRWLIKKPNQLDLTIIPPMTEKERVGLSVLK